MPGKRKRYLHDQELAVMSVVWLKGEASDADIQKALSVVEGIDRTKIPEIVRDLVQRGVLTQREEDSSYVYAPLLSRREVEEALLRDLRDSLFEGSSVRLVRALIDHGIIGKEELRAAAREI